DTLEDLNLACPRAKRLYDLPGNEQWFERSRRALIQHGHSVLPVVSSHLSPTNVLREASRRLASSSLSILDFSCPRSAAGPQAATRGNFISDLKVCQNRGHPTVPDNFQE